MSSNTLRGIGQEGDGEGEGEKTPAPTRTDASAVTTDEQENKQTNRLKDLQEVRPDARRARSLDATVPTAHSLDSSVPDAQPSLDAKIPALAATLMGVTAPVIGSSGRDMGTVQGRDVHLPLEAQRLAGMRAVIPGSGAGRSPGETNAVPVAVERSGPTIADPVPMTATPQPREAPQSHHGDLHTHAPWYDQEPVTGDMYDDGKPSVVGRVAIGVAVAAALSVIVFAILRLYAQNAAADAIETPSKPTEAYTSSSPPPLPRALPPAGADSPIAPATAPSPTARQLPSTVPTDEPPTDSVPMLPSGNGMGAVGKPHAATRVTVSSSLPPPAKILPRSPLAPHAGLLTTPPPRAALPAPPEPPAPVMGNAIPPPPRVPSEIAPPPLTAPARPAVAAPDRARVKPSYDPDSTLPLNLE